MTESTDTTRAQARRLVGYYTLGAAGAGAVPLPAASAAVVASNAAMVTHLAAHYGQDVTLRTVLISLGPLTALNLFGRQLFIEIARALSWGTGSPWAAVLLSGAGATTAGVQTYALGLLTIAIAERGGNPIPAGEAAGVIREARATYEDFVRRSRQEQGQAGPIGR